MRKRRRGTAIVETKHGILLTQMKDDYFMLPGGMAEKGEPRIITAIRELKEETNLSAVSAVLLFEHESDYCNHKVFLIKATGRSKACNEIETLGHHLSVDPSWISKSSSAILKRYAKDFKK